MALDLEPEVDEGIEIAPRKNARTTNRPWRAQFEMHKRFCERVFFVVSFH